MTDDRIPGVPAADVPAEDLPVGDAPAEQVAEVTAPVPVALPAAAWLADPARRFQYRYWDGAAWTANVSSDGGQQQDPLAVDAPPLAMGAGGPVPPPAVVGAVGPRPRIVWTTRTKVVVLAGAALLLLGSVLPWAKAEASFLGQHISKTTNGLEGDGKITLVLALIAAAVFLFVPNGKVVGWVVLAAGVLSGLVAVIDVADVNNKAGELKDVVGSADATVGIGLWLALGAAIVMVVGAVLALIEARAPTRA